MFPIDASRFPAAGGVRSPTELAVALIPFRLSISPIPVKIGLIESGQLTLYSFAYGAPATRPRSTPSTDPAQSRPFSLHFVRESHARRRGGDGVPLSLDDALNVAQHSDPAVLQTNDALSTIAEIDPWKAHVLEIRFFGGLTAEETPRTKTSRHRSANHTK